MNDANDVQVGAKISGVAGIPDGTRVIDSDLGTNTLELSQPITISLNDVANIGFVNPTIDVVDSTLADGMTVTGSGVPNGTTISVEALMGMRSHFRRPLISWVNRSCSLASWCTYYDGYILR